MDALESYYESAFTAAPGGNIYAELGPLDRLAHERRVALLDALPLGDLRDATVVDYGVGAWGVGAVFPKLKTARRIIGIDISTTAIDMSRKRSGDDEQLSGKKVEYFRASGYEFPLGSAEVDVFFAGECIEHVEDTALFLMEIHRVLKPNGIAVFTTPNRAPWMYREFGLQWCVGFEHVALMSTPELINHLSRWFRVEQLKGFNQSLHPDLDRSLAAPMAAQWVRSCEDNAHDATSVIAMCRAIPVGTVPRLKPYAFEFGTFRASGDYLDLELSSGFKGRMVEGDSWLSVDVPEGAVRCNLVFWSHAWSGAASIIAGSDQRTIDLYSHLGGCRRVEIEYLGGCRSIAIRPLGPIDARSQAGQVILFRVIFALP